MQPRWLSYNFLYKIDGILSKKYCNHCYKNGKFSDSSISMQEMINKCSTIVSDKGIMTKEKAFELMKKKIPNLERWSVS